MSDELTLACVRVVELVTAYLEGDLDADTARQLDDHLATCAPCRAYVDQIRRTISEVGRVPVDSLSADWCADLLRAFRELTQ